MRFFCSVASLVLLVACGGDDTAVDDAGPPPRDTGGADAAGRDASVDAAAIDAAAIDAGGSDDGGAIDSGGADASTAPDARVVVDAGPCLDDDREENDTLAEAMTTTEIYGPTPVSIPGRVSCPGDVDLYWAYADCCTTAGGGITWDESLGSLKIELLDDAGALVTPDSDVYVTGSHSLTKDGFGGRFFVRVTNESSNRIPYDLVVRAMVFL